ncbi:MFS transporter [Reyranella sp.]|uniref:MFS transporter n=1 Tax=Reyranella sp. TaxID=1929291 RepID=UPI0025F69F4E|nr:MFS transporter [Reyranella sp.]
MSTEAQKVGWAALLKPAWFPALAVLVGGVLLHSMNVLMLATVLPSIVEDVGGATLMSLPTTLFLASSIVAACCTGYINAVVGARRAFATGALIFGLGALVCALASTMAHVIIGRFVQGFGGGLLAAMAYVLVRSTFPEMIWTRAITLLSGAWSMSILFGPLLGGAFATYGNWRGAFYAVTALACVLAVVAVRALPRTLTGHGARPRVPGLRVALISAAIFAMSAAAASPVATVKAALFLAAIGGLALMLYIDRRAAAPLLPRDAFSFNTMTGIGLWLALLISASFSPLQLFVPTFLQVLHGLDPLAAGYMVAGGSLGWTVASIVVAGASPRWVARLLVMGPLAMAVALFGLAGLLPLKPFVLSIGPIILLGIGIGSTWAFTAQRVMSGARKGEETVAASSVATVQQAGGALGAALAGLIANLAGLSGGLTVADVTAAAYWVPACFIAIALAATVAGIRLTRTGAP